MNVCRYVFKYLYVGLRLCIICNKGKGVIRFLCTGCSLNIVFFLNSAISAAALVFYLTGVCTHTDTKGKQRKARVRNILKSSKKPQY